MLIPESAFPSDEVEAVLLTGGASLRMGSDKAHLLVENEPLGPRIARLLLEEGISVTVLGQEPYLGCAFLPDQHSQAGPLVALSHYSPKAKYVFVCSCDVPGFASRLVPELFLQLSGASCAIPTVADRMQPLCALYSADAFFIARRLVGEGERRIMQWVQGLDITCVRLEDETLALNVNNPDEWHAWQAMYQPETLICGSNLAGNSVD